MFAKQMRRYKTFSHKEARLRWTKYVAQVCFNALRHSKQEEKFSRVTQELFEDEIPRRELCELDTLEQQRQRLRDLKTLAIKNLANMQGKIFYQFFDRWRRHTEFARNFQKDDMKQ